MCTELAWDTRAGDANNSLHDEPNDDLALLLGMERLDQLFFILLLVQHQYTGVEREQVCPTKGSLNGWQPQFDTHKN